MEASASNDQGSGILLSSKLVMGWILSWQRCKHKTPPIKPSWDADSYL